MGSAGQPLNDILAPRHVHEGNAGDLSDPATQVLATRAVSSGFH